jgi:branched-chain amino acid transport system ATP-binding protein
MAAILEVHDIVAGYGRTRILRQISLSVEEGQCVGLIGPNGHGKTTLLRVITGLHTPWSGTISFRGSDLTSQSAPARVALGVVQAPQGDAVFADLNVEEHLVLALRNVDRRQRSARIREIYGTFPRLDERKRQRARTLSGGERRMLSLARMLLLDGQLLVIDEPSLGLSPLMVQEVYRQIKALSERGLSILIAEENPARLAGLASMLHLIDRGSVVASGDSDALLRDQSLAATYLGVTADMVG